MLVKNRILFVSATENEVHELIDRFSFKIPEDNFFTIQKEVTRFDILVTGIGLVNSVFNLTRHLSNYRYDAILNVGIAGSFDDTIETASVVNVCQDEFADIGVDDRGEVKSLFELGMMNRNTFPFVDGKLLSTESNYFTFFEKIRKCSAITVAHASGSQNRIEQLEKKYSPQIETMEGAAVFFCALKLNVPVIQIRSISNFVEMRNRSNWKIEESIKALNNIIIQFIETGKWQA